MADLYLRDVDEALVRELHERAKAHGRSAEEEHRLTLRNALMSVVDLIREDRDNDEPYR